MKRLTMLTAGLAVVGMTALGPANAALLPQPPACSSGGGFGNDAGRQDFTLSRSLLDVLKSGPVTMSPALMALNKARLPEGHGAGRLPGCGRAEHQDRTAGHRRPVRTDQIGHRKR